MNIPILPSPSDATATPPTPHPLLAVSDALAAIVERLGHSTVAVRAGGRHGKASGVVWRAGLVVTAAHVFRRAPESLSVVGPDGESLTATRVGADAGTDLAVFRLPDERWPALAAESLADGPATRPGELAIAVGRSSHGELTASHGIVNRTGGAWQTWLGGQIDRLIRLDGGLYDGLSGGAVADAAGRVLGIGSAALARGYGVVVPASTVTRVLDALLSQGEVARAWLGIGAQPVAAPGGGEPGLLVTALADGGPAQQGGLMVGDIVLDLDGARVDSLPALRAALHGRIGQPVRAGLLRGGVPTERALTVAAWPASGRRC